jgi:hypothetical protein
VVMTWSMMRHARGPFWVELGRVLLIVQTVCQLIEPATAHTGLNGNQCPINPKKGLNHHLSPAGAAGVGAFRCCMSARRQGGNIFKFICRPPVLLSTVLYVSKSLLSLREIESIKYLFVDRLFLVCLKKFRQSFVLHDRFN